jgi:abhydrolase domain-containing protein 17
MGNSNAIGKYVFCPQSSSYTETYPYDVTWLKTKSDKKIPSYFLRKEDKSIKTTILYSHGNASDIGNMFPLLKFLFKHLEVRKLEFIEKVNVLHYEYIGYGLSKNEQPSEANCYESIEAAIDFLKENDISKSDIIL